MERARAISKSMLSYLKRAREHKEFLLNETKEFERGKRHLANIMGLDAREMTQADIDDAMKYLFPSGLFQLRARPSMKHPDLLYATQKEAQFDIDGRPYHYLFYTVKPNYHEALSNINQTLRELNKYEDQQLATGVLDPPEDSRYDFSGRRWLDLEATCSKFIEQLELHEHEYLTKCLTTLTNHPYSSRAKAMIESYSETLPGQTINLVLPELQRDEKTGRIFTVMTTRHREHEVEVKTILNGTGIVDIEGSDILYFEQVYTRQALLFPLQLTGMLDKVDVHAKVVREPIKLGQTSVVICIREAVSRSIAAYVDEETRERMRLAGLLTTDTRLKERKKFGQEGARRKYTWKKR